MHRLYTGICIVCGLLLAVGMPAAAWTADMDVTTGTVTFDLTYGVESNTTAQADDDVDEIVPPPVPEMTKCAYFVLPDGVFKELSTDIRPEAGWQMYMNSDEDISLTWSQPPVALSLVSVGLTGDGEAVYGQAVNMSAQQSLSFEPGRYYVMITPATSSGDAPTPTIITYQPPTVVTGTHTPQPTETPVPQTPVPTVTQVKTPETSPAETAASTAVPVAAGNTEPGMTVAVPDNTTASPTQSSIPVMIPLTGAGIFLVFYLRKQ